MAKKQKFDQEAAFKAILGMGNESAEEQKGNNEIEDVNVQREEPQKGAGSSAVMITTEKKELRSQRVNLLVKPSVYKAAKQKCEEIGISLNECINQFLEKWSEE